MSTTQSESRIVVPNRLRRPIRVRISDGRSGRLREYLAHTPLRVGYGKGADIHLDSENGPDTLFEFSPVNGPTKLSTPVRLQDLNNLVDVSVDGAPFDGNVQDLKPGARVQIRDRNNDVHYELLVDHQSNRTLRFRLLTALALLVMLALVVYGVDVYRTLGDTEERLGQAESRLVDTEQANTRISEQLSELAARHSSGQLAINKALEELRAIQDASQQALGDRFAVGMKSITDDFQQALSEIARGETAAREALAVSTEKRITTLRGEVSEQLVRSYEQFNKLESQVIAEQSSRIEKLELQGEQFKAVLASSATSVMFVWTSYKVLALMSGEESPVNSTGTAFFVGDNGLAIAPQHVFEPWRYDTQFLAMKELGLVELVPNSVTHHVWMAGEQVSTPGTANGAGYSTESAYSTHSKKRGLVILYRPDPQTATRVVPSPLGVIEVQSPQAGPTDVIVFQVFGKLDTYPAQPLAPATASIKPLDEVLVVGYPMARLDNGRSSPQGVKGFVRRIGKNLLELDSALHPGSSGAPVLNAQGEIVGMAIAIFGSTTYGAAIPVSQLRQALSVASQTVRDNEERWIANGCQSTPADGALDKSNWLSMSKSDCAYRRPN